LTLVVCPTCLGSGHLVQTLSPADAPLMAAPFALALPKITHCSDCDGTGMTWTADL